MLESNHNQIPPQTKSEFFSFHFKGSFLSLRNSSRSFRVPWHEHHEAGGAHRIDPSKCKHGPSMSRTKHHRGQKHRMKRCAFRGKHERHLKLRPVRWKRRRRLVQLQETRAHGDPWY